MLGFLNFLELNIFSNLAVLLELFLKHDGMEGASLGFLFFVFLNFEVYLLLFNFVFEHHLSLFTLVFDFSEFFELLILQKLDSSMKLLLLYFADTFGLVDFREA